MKNKRSIKLWAVVAIVAAFVFVASTLLISQSYEKICPITFHLYPDTLLEKNYAASIEKHNAILSEFLSELRSDSKLNSSIKEWLGGFSRLDKSDDPGLKKRINDLHVNLRRDGFADPFVGTYLEEPKLTTERGVTVIGIPAVIKELVRIISDSTYVAAQSVHVYLQYLPVDSAEFSSINAKYPQKPGEELDIVAHIKTVLAYAPKDAPVTIEGTLPHRKVCDPIY